MISPIGARLRANRLDVRGPLADALPAGLQDSAPRAAQVALHARVDGLPVDGWADPSLRQLWGPRGAAYLVAAADWAVFTVGRLPRTAPDQLLALADRVVALLGTDQVDPAVVMPSLGRDVQEIRELARSGRLAVRWDASRITVRAVPAPSMDPVAAQRELARRFSAYSARPMSVHSPGGPASPVPSSVPRCFPGIRPACCAARCWWTARSAAGGTGRAPGSTCTRSVTTYWPTPSQRHGRCRCPAA